MKRVPANRYAWFFAIAGIGLIWDLWTKQTIFDSLGYPAGESDWVQTFFGGWMTFSFYTSVNEGALWGLGQGYSWLFASLSIVAGGAICYWLFVHGAARSLWLTVALAFIIAGALGNFYDRVGLHGCLHPETGELWYGVRDFLLFTFGDFRWPIFNFADVYLVTGAIMVVIQSFFLETEDEAASDRQQASEEPALENGGENANPSTAKQAGSSTDKRSSPPTSHPTAARLNSPAE